jgi:hypothetical protein
MHDFIVAISVTSKHVTAEQISDVVGRAPTQVRKKGELNFRGERTRETTWRLEPSSGSSSNLERLMASVLSDWPVGGTRKLQRLDPRSAIALDVAAIHHTYTVTFTVPPSIIRAAADRGLSIDVSAYPGQEPAEPRHPTSRGTTGRGKSRKRNRK